MRLNHPIYNIHFFSDKELNFQIKYPGNLPTASNPLGYISWPVSEAREVLSACFWLRTWLHSVYISHESEDGNKKYFGYGSNTSNYMFAVINDNQIHRYMDLINNN